MAFDPDAYLRSVSAPQTPPPAFDPDAYLKTIQPVAAPAVAPVAPSTPVAAPAPSIRYADIPEGPDLTGVVPQTNAMRLFSPTEPSVNALKQTGQGLASLADVTLGGIVPGVLGSVAYPVSRAFGQTPEQATATAQRLIAPFEKPFGRAFGITEEPGYTGEASRRLTEFIGQNIEKGAKWISERTGLPEADVANMLGTASIPATGLLAKGAKAAAPIVGEAAATAIEPVVAPAKKALEARQGRIAEKRAAASQANAARIEAAQDAVDRNILLNPAVSNPSVPNRIRAQMAGDLSLNQTLAQRNETTWGNIAKKELGIDVNESLARPSGTVSGEPTVFDRVRSRPEVVEPYERIRNLGTLRPDEFILRDIGAARVPKTVGNEAAVAAVDDLIAKAQTEVQAGMNSSVALDTIREFRLDAQNTLKSTSAISPTDRAIADAKLGIANALENLIDSNVRDPKLLGDFRRSRKLIAKSYAWENALDLNTGLIDPTVIAKLTAKDKAMDGEIAAVGRIAANFPEIAKPGPSNTADIVLRQFSRSKIAGTLGAAASQMMGYGTLEGGVIGAGLGEIGSRLYANRLATPEMQAKVARPIDYRPPAPPPPQVQIAPSNNLPVLFDWRNAVVTPDEYYVPNWTYGKPELATVKKEAPLQLPAPSPESTMGMVEQRRAYDLELARAKAAQSEQAATAQAAATRKPAGEGIPLELDPFTGKLRPASQGLKGATPETFENYNTALEAAAKKIQSRQRVTLTADEKIAWDRRKIDLAQIDPGLKKLSDAALADKALDRQWVADTIQKAQEKATAFEQIAQRSKDRQAVMNAQAQRERMLELADMLEEQLRMPRPVRSGTQGRKTREFQRNQLAPKSQNNLSEGQ